jgi:hypothetical protein
MTDTLQPGQKLDPGAMIVSPNGTYRFQLQTDGNPVLTKNGIALWSPGMVNSGGVKLVMQTDGNLVLYRADGVAVWNTGTQGRPGSRLVVQDDGNLVVYERTTPYWESRTHGGYYHNETSWLEDVVSTAGSPFVAVAHGVASGAEWLADAAGEVPLVGPALHGVLVIAGGPFKFTDQVIQGERIDRALINDFRDKLAGVKEVAPYAQTVISFVPGIGTGVSAAIGAGLALAQGKPIDEAIVIGVRAAIPGGPVAVAAFDLTYAAATGQNLIEAAGKSAIRTLGLPPQAQQAFNVIYRAAKGENIPLALLNEARGYLPPGPAQKAFDVGLALAQGKRLQDAAVEELAHLAPAQIQMITNAAGPILQRSPALQVAKNLIADPVAQTGFQFGMGLLAHSGVNAQAIQAVRSNLPPDQRKGFDLGLTAYQGTVASKPPAAVNRDPNTLAGYVMTKGLAKYPDVAFRNQTLAALAKNPQARIGAAYALKEEQAKRGFFSWLWHVVFG